MSPPTGHASTAKFQPKLKGDLDNIILKALRKEPERRYASAEQFAEDIRKHLNGLPVSAAPDSFSYRSNKFVRRHQFGVAAIFLIMVVVAGGVSTTLRQARIAAANQKRAEARFNDVRKLANSLLFDIHDSIADLPGATSARRLLIDRAVQYLDSLAQEANGDPGLQRELAAAYQRLGDVQGGPRAASLGNSRDALQSYLKALQLREGLPQSGGANNEDKLQLGEMHRVVAEMLHFSGDLSGTLEHARKAVSVESSVVATDGDRSKLAMGLTSAYKTLAEAEWSGMAYASLADFTAALNDFHKSLAIASAELERTPENTALARRRAFIRIEIANMLSQNGSRSEAMQELRSVLAYFRSVGAASESTRSQRDLGTVLEELGFAFERDGRLQDSTACFKEELTVLTKLFHSDPGNLQTRFDWMGANFNIAESLVRQGRANEALPMIRHALSDEEQLIAMDSNRPEYRTWLAYFHVVEAKALAQLHRDQQALASLETARELYDGVVRADQLDVDEQLSTTATDAKVAATLLRLGDAERAKQIYQSTAQASESPAGGTAPKLQAQFTLADSYAGLGDVSFSLAGKAEQQHRSSLLSDACSWYEKSMHVWHAIPNPGLISPNGFDTDGSAGVEHRLALSKCPNTTSNIH